MNFIQKNRIIWFGEFFCQNCGEIINTPQSEQHHHYHQNQVDKTAENRAKSKHEQALEEIGENESDDAGPKAQVQKARESACAPNARERQRQGAKAKNERAFA